MTTPIEEKWNIQTLLAKLDDAICSRQNAATPMDRVNAIKNVDTLKSFIENLLEQERKRMSDEIEKLKQYNSHIGIGGLHSADMQIVHNDAIDKALSIINK